jgi:hypothetical protein
MKKLVGSIAKVPKAQLNNWPSQLARKATTIGDWKTRLLQSPTSGRCRRIGHRGLLWGPDRSLTHLVAKETEIIGGPSRRGQRTKANKGTEEGKGEMKKKKERKREKRRKKRKKTRK